ncbi:MAG: metallophosphoesterase [Hamadaea sp.]|nr:metallophosphoesterase [Hamadaea sp.]NUR47398.1 metallophosphoesterase [Hamadaea sp.]NUT03528.1 metallophosphoesterase [Hamadaea sp.]
MTTPAVGRWATAGPRARLLAVSDLHVGYAENWALVRQLRPSSDEDWLLVAGDVAERPSDLEAVLGMLAGRFAKVVWVPGNHELWCRRNDPVQLRGEQRYRFLVDLCRTLGVVTPEDEYPIFEGEDGPVRIVPLFLLYDYTFRPDGTTAAQALAAAYASGVVCSDEFFLDPEPYAGRAAWCAERVRLTERRLAALDDTPMILVNHFPLVRQPTDVLRYPVFAQWCGTVRTADWHRRFPVRAVVYGHLHIPRRDLFDGVPFEEVSLGYPREWQVRGLPHGLLRDVLAPHPARTP